MELDPALYHDSLRLPADARRRLLDALEGAPVPPGLAERRRSIRVAFRGERPGLLRVRQIDGSESCHRVATRNLSRHGVGFLHGGFLHIGSPVTLAITDLDGRYIEMTGVTVRCRLIGASVHEAAVAFDQAIMMSQFVEDPPPDEGTLSSMPRKLGGRVMLVDTPGSGDGRILRAAAADQETVVQTLGGIEEVRAWLRRESYDLIVADPRLMGVSPGVMIPWLSERGSIAQVALLVNDFSPRDEQQAIEAGCVAVLHRGIEPAQAEEFLHAMLPDHIASEDAPALSCALWSHAEMRSVIADYAARIVERGHRLLQALRRGQYREAYFVCLDLKGNAASHGFQEITSDARRLLDRIGRELSQPAGDQARLVEAAYQLSRMCVAARRFVADAA